MEVCERSSDISTCYGWKSIFEQFFSATIFPTNSFNSRSSFWLGFNLSLFMYFASRLPVDSVSCATFSHLYKKKYFYSAFLKKKHCIKGEIQEKIYLAFLFRESNEKTSFSKSRGEEKCCIFFAHKDLKIK